MIKSPLRYPCGKSRAVGYLYKFIPQYEELREPFFGGGSFSFYCVQIR
ncbi:MAG: DNA adenine methylase [bacterium]